MRYKVRVDPGADFNEIASAAAACAKVFVVSHERRTLSVGDLTEAAKTSLVRMGATVLPDMQYNADGPTS